MSGEKTLNIWHPRSHKVMEKKEKERIEKEDMKLQEEERNNQLIVQNEENLKEKIQCSFCRRSIMRKNMDRHVETVHLKVS